MNYPRMNQLKRLGGQLELYAQLKTEYGSRDVAAILKEVEKNRRGDIVGKISRNPEPMSSLANRSDIKFKKISLDQLKSLFLPESLL